MKKIFYPILFIGAILSVSSVYADNLDPKNVFGVINIASTPDKIKTLEGEMGKYFVVKMIPTENSNQFLQDTVSFLYDKYFGELEQLNDPASPQRHIEIDPDYYRLFVPVTYYKSSIAQLSDVNKEALLPDDTQAKASEMFPVDENLYTTKQRVNKVVDKALLNLYLNNPEYVIFTEDELDAVPEFVDNLEREERTANRHAKRDMMNALTTTAPIEVTQEAEVEIQKPKFWTFAGNGSLQFSQHYLSDNWYKGGESSISMIGTLQLSANYNDKEKVQWENLLDAKLGFASTPSDQVHKYLTNTDQLRIFSKLGIQAAKNWYYTVSAEFKTQFLNGYKANDPTLISTFFAPADLTVALGMDFKKKTDKYAFSLLLAPLNWTMRYVGSKDVDETTYGLDPGKSVKHNFGSQIQPTLSWNIAKNIKFESRLDYLTSYKWVRVEWENTLNLAVNRYFSTKLYVHARYDDSSIPLNGSTSHFQLSELLSFGLSYNW